MAVNPTLKMLETAQERVARMITATGVRVVFNPKVRIPLADNKARIIYMPPIPDNATDADLVMMRGSLDHEVAHLLYTNHADGSPAAPLGDIVTKAGRLLGGLGNMVEDARINRLMGERFFGSQENIVRSYHEVNRLSKIKGLLSKPLTKGEERVVAATKATFLYVWGVPELAAELPATRYDEIPADVIAQLKATVEFDDVEKTAIMLRDWLFAPEPEKEKSDPSPDSGEESDEPEESKGSDEKSDPKDEGSDPGDDQGDESDDHSEDDSEDDSEDGSEEKSNDSEESESGESKDRDGGSKSEDDDIPSPPWNNNDFEDGDDENKDAPSDDRDDEATDTADEDESLNVVADKAADDAKREESSGEPEDREDFDKEKNATGGNETDEEEHINNDHFILDDEADEFIDASEELGKDAEEALALPEAPFDPRGIVPYSAETSYDREVHVRDMEREYGPFPASYIEALNTIGANLFKGLNDRVAALRGRLILDLQSTGRVFIKGMETGQALDTTSLHRPALGDGRVFKARVKKEKVDTAVSLLIDCSGSMSGEKIFTALQLAAVFCDALEMAAIPCEVLGFTTGKDFDRTFGSRSEALSLVILKSFEERAMATRNDWIKVGLNLSNNIDGESVLWAARRLAKRSEKRKVLFVLSDGNPVALNEYAGRSVRFSYKDGFWDHLYDVVRMIDRAGIEIFGIGIMTDSVKKFYPKFVVYNGLSELTHGFYTALSQMIRTGEVSFSPVGSKSA